jgi:hypothetical protein
MRRSREHRAIGIAIRCYPARWQLRHGDEAESLASALLGDGVSWWSIFLNFLGGAMRERVLRRPSVRVGSALAALAIGVGAVPFALLTSLTPAGASSTNVMITISKPADAARQLESAFSSRDFKLTVTEKPVPTRLIGSILSVNTYGKSGANDRVVSELRGKCADGGLGCIYAIVLPRHFSGNAHVTIGRAAN